MSNLRTTYFDSNGVNKSALIIGVTGGLYSGKTLLSDEIVKRLKESLNIKTAASINQSSFIKEETLKEKDWNSQDPNVLDYDKMIEVLQKLKRGESVKTRKFDIKKKCFEGETEICGAEVVLCVGTLLFCNQKIRDIVDIKIFVDSEEDERLMNLLRSDCKLGRNPYDILVDYENYYKPSYYKYVALKRKMCDIVVPFSVAEHSSVAIELIVNKIKSFCWDLKSSESAQLPQNVTVIKQSPQVRAAFTILRDRLTYQSEFAFYADRIIFIILEQALSLIPHEKKTIKTRSGKEIDGMSPVNKVISVSINMGGCSLEHSLLSLQTGIGCGRIIIEDEPYPAIKYYSLLQIPANHYVILMDHSLRSGTTLITAISKLLELNVSEDKIIFVALIASVVGINAVYSRFPNIKMVVGQIDNTPLNSNKDIPTGFGDYSYRYFGTMPFQFH